MRPVLSTLIVFALTACNDVVTTRFGTLAEAKRKGAFERGWLPPLLPASARNIVERNNLDRNIGRGCFEYDISERNAYLQSLSRAGASIRTQPDADIVTLITNGSRWEIWLARRLGRAQWRVESL